MAEMTLESYFEELKTAIERKDVKTLKGKLQIWDNYSFVFYGPENDIRDRSGKLRNQMGQDFMDSSHSDEFFKSAYTFMRDFRNTEDKPAWLFKQFDRDDGITKVQVVYYLEDSEKVPDYAFYVSFHNHLKMGESPVSKYDEALSADENIEEILKYFRNHEEELDKAANKRTIAIAGAIYEFAQYAIKRQYKFRITSIMNKLNLMSTNQ